MPEAAQTDSSSRCRGQIDIPTSNKGATIVDMNCNASAVTDAKPGAKRQPSMSRRHCRAIYSLSIGRAASAITVASAIDACHLRMRRAYKPEKGQRHTDSTWSKTNRLFHTSVPCVHTSVACGRGHI
jgi:hypothetical protein